MVKIFLMEEYAPVVMKRVCMMSAKEEDLARKARSFDPARGEGGVRLCDSHLNLSREDTFKDELLTR